MRAPLHFVPGEALGGSEQTSASPGSTNWKRELKAETWATPLLADGKLYLGARRGMFVLAAGRKPAELARISLGAPAYGTPIAANGTLFVTSQKQLWAVRRGARLVTTTR